MHGRARRTHPQDRHEGIGGSAQVSKEWVRVEPERNVLSPGRSGCASPSYHSFLRDASCISTFQILSSGSSLESLLLFFFLFICVYHLCRSQNMINHVSCIWIYQLDFAQPLQCIEYGKQLSHFYTFFLSILFSSTPRTCKSLNFSIQTVFVFPCNASLYTLCV